MRNCLVSVAYLLLAACGSGDDVSEAPDASSASPASSTSELASASAPACLVQGTERLWSARLRAVGTEPFWAADIEGRCVTYSHPGDRKGTRVWTRYANHAGGDTWSGSLAGRTFELRTRPDRSCSDGMSDKRYPIAVELTVGGELRRGCAEPT